MKLIALLSLKAEYKQVTGQDWDPNKEAANVNQPTSTNQSTTANLIEDNLNDKIKQQGNKIRALKASKADKNQIKSEVDTLLSLKAQFKEATGQEWDPNNKATSSNASNSTDQLNLPEDELLHKIKEQGDKIRVLKASKADKNQIKK